MYTQCVLNVKTVNYTAYMMTSSDSGRGTTGRPSAGERAYSCIRDAILKGEFKEGDFLDEVELAHFVGTSRTPVREALKRLAAEKFVDILPRRGTQVHIISPTELEEGFTARYVFESFAIGELVDQNIDPTVLSDPHLVDHEAAGREQRWYDVVVADQRFHSSLVSQAGNSIITELHESLLRRQFRMGVRTVSSMPQRIDLINAQHREILESIRAGDKARALSVLQAHLLDIPGISSNSYS